MVIVIMMFSKTNERGKLIIPEIRSRQGSKGRGIRRQSPDQVEYGTDQKRQLDRSLNSDLQPNEGISCSHCRARMSQFVTKKPTHPVERSTQTSQKPFLIDLIEQKVQNLCRGNSSLSRMLQQRQDELMEKQHQISEIQDKFTSILLSLSQQVANGRKQSSEWHEMKRLLTSDSDTPAYLKALQLDC